MEAAKFLLTTFFIISVFLISGCKQTKSGTKPNEITAVQEANQVPETNESTSETTE